MNYQNQKEKNKDKIQENYEKKGKINAIQRTPHICDICNGRYTYTNRIQHIKSIKHQTALNNND